MPATTKLYVGNLPDQCKDEAIRDLFSPYGELAELTVIKNFAFVHFKDEEIAKNAVRDLNGTKLLGKQISVEISKSRGGGGDKDKGRDNRRMPDRRRDNAPRDRVPGNFSNIGNQDFAQTLSNLSGMLGGGMPQNPILGAPLGTPLGGPLGAPLGIAPPALGNLGILSAVNTLAAVAEKQKEMAHQQQQQLSAPRQPPQDDRQPREPARNAAPAETPKPSSNNNGYVIYERYYVDPNHALLKGLPLPQLPRVQGSHIGYPEKPANNPSVGGGRGDPYSIISRDASRSDLYAIPSRGDSDNYRSRSPQMSRRDIDNNDRWNPANY